MDVDLSRVGRAKSLKNVTHGSIFSIVAAVPGYQGTANARSTMSFKSRERPGVVFKRVNAASALARRPLSSIRQVRKAVASRAETCGFFGSSARTVSATNSYPAPSARLNWVGLPCAKAPISARTRFGLAREKAGCAVRLRTLSRAPGSGTVACRENHLSTTRASDE